MSFKDMLQRDIHGVFLNDGEFAETKTVIYDGVTYKDIPVVLTKVREKDKFPNVSNDKFANRAGGLISSTVMFCAAKDDLGGNVPEQGGRIMISNGYAGGKDYFEKYLIVTSSYEIGMITLELEAIDE